MRPFIHPLALGIVLVSAVAALTIERVAWWSNRSLWVSGWGLLAYAAVVSTVLIRQKRASLQLRPSRILATAARPLPDRTEMALAARPQLIEGNTADDLASITQEALRRLNNPAALGGCALVTRLPHLLAAHSIGHSQLEMTQLDQARALRVVLMACIERLKESSGARPLEGEGGRHVILYDEYVLGRPNNQIMTRYSISESTFHRYRREAIVALTRELSRQEELAARPDSEAD